MPPPAGRSACMLPICMYLVCTINIVMSNKEQLISADTVLNNYFVFVKKKNSIQLCLKLQSISVSG